MTPVVHHGSYQPSRWWRRRSPRIGLVLGGGGITGFAYHSGALSALQETTGWDPRTADVIVGTSAGAGVGAIIRGGVPVDEVLGHLLAVPSSPDSMNRLRVLSGRDTAGPRWWWFGPSSPRLLLRELSRPWAARLGRVAISLLPNGRIPTDYLGDRVRELHGLDWPEEALWVCALRLGDGERVVFGADRGDAGERADAGTGPGLAPGVDIDVGTAVEASSAIPGFFRPVAVDGVRYVDGAVHSPTNVDVLADCDLDLIVVSSPMSGDGRAAIRSLDAITRIPSGHTLGRELRRLDPGVGYLVLQPGAEEIQTMGPINMDPTRLVPTVLQSRAATLQGLAVLGDDPLLGALRRAATSAPDLPRVDYPTRGRSRRAS